MSLSSELLAFGLYWEPFITSWGCYLWPWRCLKCCLLTHKTLFFFIVTKKQHQVFFIIFLSTEWPEIVGKTFLAPLFSYLLHLSASCYNIWKNSSVLCFLQRLEGRRQLASVAGPELCPSFIYSAWLSHPQLVWLLCYHLHCFKLCHFNY